jgi:hypothetical protein
MTKTKFLSPKNDLDLKIALRTMALFPDDAEAVAQLKEHHGLTVTVAHLGSLRHRYPEQLLEAREKIAIQRERALISDLGDNAALAGLVVRGALKEQREQLEAGYVKDPSRVARDVADVQAKAIDKSRLLQDKPTQITQTISDTQFYTIEAKLEAMIAEQEIEDAEVAPADELPAAPSEG